jgi:hypothetical protein
MPESWEGLAMAERKTLVCTCENCGSEAEMTIKCEEVGVGEPKRPAPAAPPPKEQVKRTIVCTRCGNEADLLVDL